MAFLLISQLDGTSKSQVRSRSLAVKYGLLSGVFFAINNTLFNASLAWTDTLSAVFLSNTGVIWVGIFVLFLHRQQLPSKFWLAVSIAILGIYFVSMYPGEIQIGLGLGEILALGAAFFYAALLMANESSRRINTTVNHMFLLNSSALIALLFFNLVTGQVIWGYTTDKLFLLLMLALVPQLLGFYLISYAQKHISATHTSLMLLLQPVMSSIFAVFFLNETFMISQMVGAFLILVGIYMGRQSRHIEHS
jgi:drug/metabolite transporter (DMT)-like permease